MTGHLTPATLRAAEARRVWNLRDEIIDARYDGKVEPQEAREQIGLLANFAEAVEAGITVTEARAIEFGSCCVCGSDVIWFLPVERELFSERCCTDKCLERKRDEEHERDVKDTQDDAVRP